MENRFLPRCLFVTFLQSAFAISVGALLCRYLRIEGHVYKLRLSVCGRILSDFRWLRRFLHSIRYLLYNQQKEQKKRIFGGGFLISEQCAAERERAERERAERERAEHFELSDREKEIIKELSK